MINDPETIHPTYYTYLELCLWSVTEGVYSCLKFLDGMHTEYMIDTYVTNVSNVD